MMHFYCCKNFTFTQLSARFTNYTFNENCSDANAHLSPIPATKTHIIDIIISTRYARTYTATNYKRKPPNTAASWKSTQLRTHKNDCRMSARNAQYHDWEWNTGKQYWQAGNAGHSRVIDNCSRLDTCYSKDCKHFNHSVQGVQLVDCG